MDSPFQFCGSYQHRHWNMEISPAGAGAHTICAADDHQSESNYTMMMQMMGFQQRYNKYEIDDHHRLSCSELMEEYDLQIPFCRSSSALSNPSHTDHDAALDHHQVIKSL